jgi:hypothetical protein
MRTNPIVIGAITAVEIMSDEALIKNEQDALDIMALASSDYIILHEHNFNKDFFDLSTRFAGEILQKFTNYHVSLAIIGNFEKFKSKSLKDFIYESNKVGKHIFVRSIEETIKIWQRNK